MVCISDIDSPKNMDEFFKSSSSIGESTWRSIRHAYMIYDNFKISGKGEALLGFNDLLRVQLNNDNMEGFDTRWDEVLLSMTDVPDEDSLDKCTKKKFSEELTLLVALYLQDTVQKGEAASYSRLKEMVPRYVGQKIRDKNFNARNEDRSLQGQQLGKETTKKITLAMQRKRSKVDHWTL